MARVFEAGYVTPAGQDVLPTEGPHLDVRVSKDDKYIDPSTIRSLLTRLKIGKERKPLWQQVGQEWKPNFQITSGYGPRKAPVAGASTYHPAHDYGIAGGTPIAWEGPGKFTPGKGYGIIETTDAQGTPYKIKLLHTKGGKSVDMGQQAPQTAEAPKQPQAQGDTYIYLLGKKERQDSGQDFLSSYIQESLMGSTPEFKSVFDPTVLLAKAFAQTPNYMS